MNGSMLPNLLHHGNKMSLVWHIRNKDSSCWVCIYSIESIPWTNPGVINICGHWAHNDLGIWSTKHQDQSAPSENACVQLGGVSETCSVSLGDWESLGKEVTLDISLRDGPSAFPWGKLGWGERQMRVKIALNLPTTLSCPLYIQPLSSSSSLWYTCTSCPRDVWLYRETKHKFFHCTHLLTFLHSSKHSDEPEAYLSWVIAACAQGKLWVGAVVSGIKLQGNG